MVRKKELVPTGFRGEAEAGFDEEYQARYWQLIKAAKMVAELSGILDSNGRGRRWAVMELPDNPPFRDERWWVGVEECGERMRFLLIKQKLWSPTLGEFVDGKSIELGRVRRRYVATDFPGDVTGFDWLVSYEKGCRHLVEYLKAAEVEEVVVEEL